MSATRQLGANVNAGTVASGATTYSTPGDDNCSFDTTELNRGVAFRTAGTMSKLTVRLTAGDRTPGTIQVLVNGSTVGGGLSISYTTTPGEFTDASGSNAITAGQRVAIRFTSGAGGTVNFGFTQKGFVWSATSTTTKHHSICLINSINSASTSFYQFQGQGNLFTTTQADGEVQIKLPPGVQSVTIKNLFVRLSSNTNTNSATVTLVGATGTGTAPNVTITAASGAATFEDSSNSIKVKDGDKISWRITTGAGTISWAIAQICCEIQSDDDTSFFITNYGNNNTTITNNNYLALAGHTGQTATESLTQASFLLTDGQVLGYFSVRVATTGTGAVFVRSNTADTAITVSTASSGWQADVTHTIKPASTDVLNTRNSVSAGTPAIGEYVLACYLPKVKMGQLFLNQSVKRAAVY